jgi:hypothetical protein
MAGSLRAVGDSDVSWGAAVMDDDWLQDPDSLWHTTGLSREEFVQRLLSTLVSAMPCTDRTGPAHQATEGSCT